MDDAKQILALIALSEAMFSKGDDDDRQREEGGDGEPAEKAHSLTTARTASRIRSAFGKYAASRFFAYGVGTSMVLTRTGS